MRAAVRCSIWFLLIRRLTGLTSKGSVMLVCFTTSANYPFFKCFLMHSFTWFLIRKVSTKTASNTFFSFKSCLKRIVFIEIKHLQNKIKKINLPAVGCIRKITDVQQEQRDKNSRIKSERRRICNLSPRWRRWCVHGSLGSVTALCPKSHQGALFAVECRQMEQLSRGNGSYRGVAGSRWPSVDSRLVVEPCPIGAPAGHI